MPDKGVITGASDRDPYFARSIDRLQARLGVLDTLQAQVAELQKQVAALQVQTQALQDHT